MVLPQHTTRAGRRLMMEAIKGRVRAGLPRNKKNA
jgi:hypothetical protein